MHRFRKVELVEELREGFRPMARGDFRLVGEDMDDSMDEGCQ